ncbi:MAG: universal stress protein [Verrucomicrobia bacterium]|nr:universal stress protein [Verrucomicrobiota bacterium]
MQVVSPTAASMPARIHTSREAFMLFPSGASRLLVLLDPSLQPEPILGIALELSEQWTPEITIMHGGLLEVAGELEAETDQAKLTDLLCLCWQIRGSYPEVSISRKLPRSVGEVFQEAVERRTDLILASESVMGTSRRAGYKRERPGRSTTEPPGMVEPCPVLVVTSSGWELPKEQVATAEWFR